MGEGLEKNNPGFTRESVKTLFDQLNPRDQLLTVILLIGMPRDARASEDLTLAEQEEVVMNWAETEGPGLAKLADAINYVIKKQTPG